MFKNLIVLSRINNHYNKLCQKLFFKTDRMYVKEFMRPGYCAWSGILDERIDIDNVKH